MMDLSIPYYEDNTRISNSAIGWFLNKGPAFLRAKLDEKIEDESSPQLERGTMIHMYLLQPDEFIEHYSRFTKAKPKSINQEKFCKELVNSTEIELNKKLISAYKSAYSTIGCSNEEILSKAKQIASELKDYMEEVKSGKKLISDYDVRTLNWLKQNISDHKMAEKLIRPEFTIYDAKTMDDESKLVGGKIEGLPIAEVLYHEFHINWEHEGLKCKSLLDSLHLDFKNKRYTIVDLKTTAKIYHFEDSIKEYDYLRQLYFYTMAVDWYLKNELGEDPAEWDRSCFIVAVDTINQHDVRVFNILRSDFERNDTENRICNALSEIKWHTETGKWDHSREYYAGNGCETLNL